MYENCLEKPAPQAPRFSVRFQKFRGFLGNLLVSKVNRETMRFTLKLPSAGFDPRVCLHVLCADQPCTIEPTEEPPRVPLRSRISDPDVADFEFLLTLDAFSARELKGVSYLESDHFDRCLRVARKMRAEKLSPSQFQHSLAEFFVDWTLAYVYARRALDINPSLVIAGGRPDDLSFESEPCVLDLRDFTCFHPSIPESAGPLQSLLGAWNCFLSWFLG